MPGTKIGCVPLSTAGHDLVAQREGLAGVGVDSKLIYVDHGLSPEATGTDQGLRRPSQRSGMVTHSW
jgi:hypothetical protein